MREVAVWVQMDTVVEFDFIYAPVENENDQRVKHFKSGKQNAYILHLIADDLDIETTYSYKLIIGSKVLAKGKFSTQKLWQHRSDPPNFSFLIGSCTYVNESAYDRPGEPYGKGMSIFSAMNQKGAEGMLWLGDNIYLREADLDSKTGIYHRYTHYKSQKELQDFWGSVHHYAIWDDHDYGPNDGNRSFVNKDITLQAFKDFWANPNYGLDGKENCTSGMFSYNDIDFFLLDNRSFRSPNERKSGKREILGDSQINWLIDALVSSKASFKVVAVGGQFLSPAAVYENHATFPEEREKILRLIDQEQIQNIIFLSGDRHKTELTKLETENGVVIYDFTSSPLTSTSYNTIEEGNNLRVEGSHYAKQNFGMLEFTGGLKERKVILKTFDQEGKLVWEKTIEAKD